MSTRLDRMIRRARAPLSALQPVVPSLLAPDQASREDAQEAELRQATRMQPSINFGDRPPSDAKQLRSISASLPDMPPAPRDRRDVSITPSVTVASATSPAIGEGEYAYSRSPDRARIPERALQRDDSITASAQPAASDEWLDAKGDRRSPAEALPMPYAHENRTAQTAGSAATVSTRAKQASPPTAQSAGPLIEVNVSIGSVDFRMARSPEPVRRSEAHPRVTLDSYLQRGKRDAR
jgi:hypothetical protein